AAVAQRRGSEGGRVPRAARWHSVGARSRAGNGDRREPGCVVTGGQAAACGPDSGNAAPASAAAARSDLVRAHATPIAQVTPMPTVSRLRSPTLSCIGEAQ